MLIFGINGISSFFVGIAVSCQVFKVFRARSPMKPEVDWLWHDECVSSDQFKYTPSISN